MKKLLSIIALSIFVGISAQTELGIKAGYNLSGMKYGDYQFKNKSYFYIGGLVEHRLNEKFSVQGELLYTELGGKDTSMMLLESGSQTAHIRLPQIQIPVSAKYYFANPFSLSAGLNFGFNINPNIEFTPEDNYNKNGKLQNIKTINLFPFLGAEYKFKNNIFFDSKYNFNFFRINKEGNLNQKIAVFQIGLGYRFK